MHSAFSWQEAKMGLRGAHANVEANRRRPVTNLSISSAALSIYRKMRRLDRLQGPGGDEWWELNRALNKEMGPVNVPKAKRETDERATLAHVVHWLKELHGPRIVAHWLYHQARALTLEADKQAMTEAEQNEKRSAGLRCCAATIAARRWHPCLAGCDQIFIEAVWRARGCNSRKQAGRYRGVMNGLPKQITFQSSNTFPYCVNAARLHKKLACIRKTEFCRAGNFACFAKLRAKQLNKAIR
jgi:hypothetical protein